MKPGDRYLETGSLTYATVVAIDSDEVWLRLSETDQRILRVDDLLKRWVPLEHFDIGNPIGVSQLPDGRVGFEFPDRLPAAAGRRAAVGFAARILQAVDPELMLLPTAMQIIKDEQATVEEGPQR